jgi:hypothetical protein
MGAGCIVIEGETLAERIKGGGIPLDEGRQTANAFSSFPRSKPPQCLQRAPKTRLPSLSR